MSDQARAALRDTAAHLRDLADALDQAAQAEDDAEHEARMKAQGKAMLEQATRRVDGKPIGRGGR